MKRSTPEQIAAWRRRSKQLDNRRAPLRRTGWGKRGQPTAQASANLPEPKLPVTCWLAQFDPEVSCDDTRHLDRCHILPKQFLRRIGVQDIWHPDWWVLGCRRHHYRLDNYFFRPKREDLPEGIERRADRNAAVAARLSRDFRRRGSMEEAA